MFNWVRPGSDQGTTKLRFKNNCRVSARSKQVWGSGQPGFCSGSLVAFSGSPRFVILHSHNSAKRRPRRLLSMRRLELDASAGGHTLRLQLSTLRPRVVAAQEE